MNVKLFNQTMNKQQIKNNWKKIDVLRKRIPILKADLREKEKEMERLLRETPLP